MIIFIPTRGRVDKQITRRNFFLDELDIRVVYVVPKCEASQWKYGAELFVVPDDYRIADIRQHIIDEWWKEDKFHIVIDDDLRFQRRIAPTNPSQREGTIEDAKDLIMRVHSWFMDGYTHGALSTRPGNHRVPEAYKENTRALDFHFYDAEIIHKENLKFTDIILKEDFHMTLSMIELGYPNIVDYEFMAGQKDNSNNNKGGCNVFRTPEMINQSAIDLHNLHPDNVKLIEKNSKMVYGGGKRLEVICYWKKSYCTKENQRKLFKEKSCTL